ncbi:hypothetical protein LP419_38125 [Massilia sp. H-1]|nr:hypothetical protein LP419_38125 [Massilia sp. H-1]
MNAIVSRFRRFLAIILLLILPLQSSVAAVDGCCTGVTGGQPLAYQADGGADQAANGVQATDEADCCALCDFCHHGSVTFLSAPGSVHGEKLTCAPVPSPELPITSFIPDVPSRPDRG